MAAPVCRARGGVLRFLDEEPVGGITSIGQVGYAERAGIRALSSSRRLARQLRTYASHPRNVATRPCEASHQARPYRIGTGGMTMGIDCRGLGRLDFLSWRM